jgi:Transglutaminase-like superfamily
VIAYDLELYKVRLCTGTSPADSKDKRSAPTIYDIKPTHCLDYTNADFQKYLSDFRLRRGGNESNLAFAHRAFQIFCADMASRFQERASAAGLGGLVSKLCQRDMHAGGCGDCAFQFVAILRANGVPARVVTGRWAETATPDFGMFHVRSDFYDPSIGWIPVDSNFGFADLLKGRDNECQFEKSAMGDFVTMHLNTDVHPAGTSFEAPAHQFGIVEYIGKDPFHPKYGHETWTVKKIY